MNHTRNTLPRDVRKESVALLNHAVADLFDLYARIKQAHWNLRGVSFIGIHKLLDEFAATIIESLDETAERAKALGGLVAGTLEEAAHNTDLKSKDQPRNKPGQRDWISELADSHAECADQVRRAVKKMTKSEDFGSADLLTQVLRDLDKQLWLLESHLEK